jgi:hypothetical protein
MAVAPPDRFGASTERRYQLRLSLEHGSGPNPPRRCVQEHSSGSGLADLTVNYGDLASRCTLLEATGFDPDLHELRYAWRNSDGNIMATDTSYFPHDSRALHRR